LHRCVALWAGVTVRYKIASAFVASCRLGVLVLRPAGDYGTLMAGKMLCAWCLYAKLADSPRCISANSSLIDSYSVLSIAWGLTVFLRLKAGTQFSNLHALSVDLEH